MIGQSYILASKSPRRRDLLSRLGIPFEMLAPEVHEEVGGQDARPERVVRRLASTKARAVAARHPDAVILAADTVVAHRGVILGKPRDAADAGMVLQGLRGHTHSVATGVAVARPGKRLLIEHEVTRVSMRRYGDEEIAASIARGDLFDKAGAYAIQDEAFRPVESYEGCYCNVVGLPVWTAIRLLGRAGLDITRITASDLLPRCASCPLAPGQPV